MKANAVILWVVFGTVILLPFIILKTFRSLTRSPRLRALVEDGVLVTENGLEFPTLFFMGTKTVKYADVESVEVVASSEGLRAVPPLRYGLAVSAMGTRFSNEYVAIKIKGKFFKNVLVTPRDTRGFAQQLQARIQQRGGSPGGT